MGNFKDLNLFISYRRENGGIAYAFILQERLSKLGVQSFFDINSMHDYNEDFEREILINIEKSDYVIILLQDNCLKEREGNDYYLQEIRFALKHKKDLILLPIGKHFEWEKQKNVPEDIKKIAKINMCTPLELEHIEESMKSILSMFKKDNARIHYLMLSKIMNSSKNVSAPILQKTSDIYYVDLKERWERAKRVSLMAVGCSSVVTRFASLIESKAVEGTQFRFLAIDPEGDSANDFTKNKLNSNVNSARDNFLQENYNSMIQIIGSMKKTNGSVEYRLTSEHITFTMHWVECVNDNESYIYIEFLPIIASNILQDVHNAVILKRNDPSYEFYAKQFSEVWKNSRIGIENAGVHNCEFCFPPKKDDKFILCETKYWRVYLANNQNYPGRCIIPLRRHCENLSEISIHEMTEFYQIIRILEKIWKRELNATNFNWTCLMNGGYAQKPYIPHVHFHFIPRYDHPYKMQEGEFVDLNFGNHYELSQDFQLSDSERIRMCEQLKKCIAEEMEYL